MELSNEPCEIVSGSKALNRIIASVVKCFTVPRSHQERSHRRNCYGVERSGEYKLLHRFTSIITCLNDVNIF